MAETKTEAKKDPAPKRMRVRAIAPGWYGNRRRIPGRPGQEFDLVLNWIPEQLHEEADPAKNIKVGDVKRAARYQKMPSWVVVISKKAAKPEGEIEGELEEQPEIESTSSDESPL